jgi:hypothetical protein
VSYTVRFKTALPAEGGEEIVRVVQLIAEAVSTISPSSPFWSSMEDSQLQVDVFGHRVVYKIDPLFRQIIVVEVSAK